MKTNYFQSLAAFIAIASMTASASTALAQDSTATAQTGSTSTTQTAGQTDSAAPAQTASAAAPAVAVAPAPQLAYGVSQILELSQAKVDDGTIISYIRNSGNSYGLNADQIIYLRQQGVSSAVLNAMLSQPAPGVLGAGSGVPLPSSPAPQVSYPQPPPQNTGMVGPSVSAVDPTAVAAANYYYYQPYYYPTYYSYPYYYPGYAYYPGVSVSLGWGGRLGGWGGGFHGGGWGGGFHGGWHH